MISCYQTLLALVSTAALRHYILVDGHQFTRADLCRILSPPGLTLDDHCNMDVQTMIRLLVNNLGVSRAEYEAWFEPTGRASRKEVMRCFDKVGRCRLTPGFRS